MSTQTLNISLPKEMVKKIDRYAKESYQNRSEMIRDAIRARLKELEDWEDIFSYGQKIGKKMGIKSEEDVYRIMDEIRHGKRAS